MKIKPPSKKHLKRASLRRSNEHYWLVPEQPRKVGRLGQLNKMNKRMRVKSEFQIMITKIEEGS